MFDVATIQVTKHTLAYISEEMGVALKKSAFSPNIRERADHSCAILDRHGRTLGQAEQIPVHIGSLPIGLKNSLEYLRKAGVEPEKGDMFIVNDPYISGTHLNDITLIRPVYVTGEILGFVANKAHHVDVGGMVPASISPKATELYQEGLIIPPARLMQKGRVRTELVEILETNSRVPEFTRGDLRAQIAANLLGERRLLDFVWKMGRRNFAAAADEVLEQTNRSVLQEYNRMQKGEWRGEDFLELEDALLRIKARVIISAQKIEVDFDGTSEQVKAPLNAVYGVTVAAVTYAVKTLLPPDVALNDGFNRTVVVRTPRRTIVNPEKPAAVAAGNLETSQRIVDAVYKALAKAFSNKIPAASHGSMNNLMMGGIDPLDGRSWAFYETIGGGSGARPGKDGVNGIQVNMTNTMNTPIEVMEHYYPVFFTSYQLREGSGGVGRWRGGLGIERAFLAKAKVAVSVLGDRSKIAPWGLHGGGSGGLSEYLVERKGKAAVPLPSKSSLELEEGDRLIMRTAGGGGFGDSGLREKKARRRDRNYGYR